MASNPNDPQSLLGNTIALEGNDRCFCGCKYWERDRCIDCGTHVSKVPEEVRRG